MRYKVSIVDAGSDVRAATAEALQLIGWKPERNQSHLIKPNMIVPKSSEKGVTTDPRIVGALIGIVRECGGEALVGDSPGNAYPARAREVFESTGMLKAVDEAGGKFVSFESSTPKIVTTDGKMIKSMAIAAPVFSNRLINVPKLKTHVQTVMTGAIKNVAFGCVPGNAKGQLHIIGNSSERLGSAIADIYSVIRPHISLNVMDAIMCMEGNGPTAGKAKKVGKLLASTDALALDIVSFKMAGLEPKNVPYVNEAMSRTLGPSSFDEIEILGDLPKLKFKLPATLLTSLASSVGGVFVSVTRSSASVVKSKCKKCGSCLTACPVSAITMDECANLDQSRCIKCFVCYEVCENGAIRLRRRFLRR